MKTIPDDVTSANTDRLSKLLVGAFGQEGKQQDVAHLPAGAIYLEALHVLVAGTACDAATYDQALRDAAVEFNADVILIRHGPFPETLNEVRFDLAVRLNLGVVLLKDLLLYFRATDGYWLMPAGRGPYAALGGEGVRITFEPPFMTHHYFEEGVTAAAAQIVRAVRKGSF
ncbi:MAG TPA: hypothetical protein VGB79_10320 [Allosphingosinicella sp.]|jgi:hypothetical protein